MTHAKPNATQVVRARRLVQPIALIILAALMLLFLPTCGVNRTDPRSYGSPEDAVRALVDAARADNVPALMAILGEAGEDILTSGDEVADRQRLRKFADLYDARHILVHDGPDRFTLVIGDKDWPFPIPLVRSAGTGWVFDTAAGREEILNRRIGQNELDAIQVCKAIGDAQHDFALQTTTPDGLHEYAQRFLSEPGKQNGLYWKTADGEPPSPLGDLAAKASAEGYTRRQEGPTPYHGYYYRILRAQGPNAPDGTVDYVVKDHMILGFAVLAYPAEYANSGIMTFMMGADGVVYQKDLGQDTAKIASEMEVFDPGPGWKKAE